jgi:hypothetical protein
MGGLTMWNEKNISRLEGTLERLVESAFTSFFRKPVSAHDMAVKLARSMTSNTQPSQDGDVRPIAPDRYVIHLNKEVCDKFAKSQETVTNELAQQMIDLAAKLGYRLVEHPQVLFQADTKLRTGDLTVDSSHSAVAPSTAMMQPIKMPTAQPMFSCHLLVGERAITLTQAIVNIGRSDENTIIVEDAFVSRHHAQLRLRNGVYLLFDVDSKSGTFVNDIAVREHRLQSGDVIRIGNTKLIFVVDGAPRTTGTTELIDPIKA